MLTHVTMTNDCLGASYERGSMARGVGGNEMREALKCPPCCLTRVAECRREWCIVKACPAIRTA